MNVVDVYGVLSALFLPLLKMTSGFEAHSSAGGLPYFWLPSEWCCPDYKSHQIHNPHVPWGLPFRAHRTIPKGFRLRRSNIWKAGLGIFSDSFVAPFTWLGEYEGTHLPKCGPEDAVSFCAEFLTGCDYAFRIHRGGSFISLVDAADPTSSNWLRWVNCARNRKEENVVARECLGKIYFQTIKPIIPGTELYVYYGDDYAKYLGIDFDNVQGET